MNLSIVVYVFVPIYLESEEIIMVRALLKSYIWRVGGGRACIYLESEEIIMSYV